MKHNYLTFFLLLSVMLAKSAFADIVVIGSSNMGTLTHDTVLRIYTGRIIELDGLSVIPVNAKPQSPLRNKFLDKFLKQDEDKYSAYWTVRRFIGKGTPPIELNNDKEILRFVIDRPGAIGYVDTDNVMLPPTVTVLAD
ncbi:hypothetical protein P7F88_06920 [Vibrio hannami]|uniref:hypothetical protein n=1 Tax=Vibrio hannami TaxID=2717094 RepID=UPI00240F58D2|nr:hypothetical protein [Vibrio hannami]MDG3085841.1 hypothetical protein [Vibrio hannami]